MFWSLQFTCFVYSFGLVDVSTISLFLFIKLRTLDDSKLTLTLALSAESVPLDCHGVKSNVSNRAQLIISLPAPIFLITNGWEYSTASEFLHITAANVELYSWTNWAEK